MNMAKLDRNFYIGDTVDIARKLIGCYLVRRYEGLPLVCRICETEAYVGAIDKACHAYGYHKTSRNATMFGEPGHAYIYLIYGMYHCLNFVTNPVGEPDAILLRGLQPVYHTQQICRLRFGKELSELTAYQRRNFLNGPGKCCKGLALDKSFDATDLTGDDLFICTRLSDIGLPDAATPDFRIASGPRIGIDYAEEAVSFPWRFWMEEKQC